MNFQLPWINLYHVTQSKVWKHILNASTNCLIESDKYFLFLVIEVNNSKSEYSYTLSFNRLEFTLNFKFNSLNINSKRFSIGAEIKKLNVLRKLLLLLLNLLIFYSDYLRQVVACGSKSATGRDFNADMKSEIS